MRIIEKLIAKFKKKEPRIVLARDLTDYMIKDRIIVVPNYKESREERKLREKTHRQVRKNFER